MSSSEDPGRGAWRERLEGRFWGASQLWRRPARRLLRRLSALKHRALAAARTLPPRVVHEPARSTPPLAEPHLFLRGEVPAVTAEALLLAAAAEDLQLVLAGAGEPADGEHGPSGEVRPFARGDARLLAAPRAGAAAAVVGRIVPILGEADSKTNSKTDSKADSEHRSVVTETAFRRAGPHLLRPDVGGGPLLRRPLYDVERRLAHVEPEDGPPSLLFLLPYLAVGGAERLLFDLLAGLGDRRCLVVTLDPHLRRLGHTVDRCRALTPHVFTLGDWLPRRAAWSALRHLVRRHRVHTLVSWNGTVDFFDRAHELRRDFPRLRLLSQLYHHRGGFMARTSPRVIGAVDRHLAVNRPIAEALARRGVPAERIALVHHGVEVPETSGVSAEDRLERRRRLDLPAGALAEDAVVVGTFIRLHAQKRPLDLVALARRFEDEPVYFLLVGGGPLEGELDAELARRPASRLVRRPMTREPLPLYDALDLCLMTSAYEGLPVFLLDGLARGLPAVAPAVGEIPLLFAGGGGLGVDEPGDLDGLEAALRRLLDPGERRRRGELGRRTVAERFGLERYRRDYRRELLGETSKSQEPES